MERGIIGRGAAAALLTALLTFVSSAGWASLAANAGTAVLATSLFWSLMADVWTADQGKRLFGLVATGASLGAIGGSGMLYVTAFWTRPTYALLLCAVLLEVCARLGRAVVRHADASSSGRSGGRERAGALLLPLHSDGGSWRARARKAQNAPTLKALAPAPIISTRRSGSRYLRPLLLVLMYLRLLMNAILPSRCFGDAQVSATVESLTDEEPSSFCFPQ